MCKKLVSVEIYENTKRAFQILDHLRNETGLSWSMIKRAPDMYGRTSYQVYGMFDVEDLECAQNAVNEVEV